MKLFTVILGLFLSFAVFAQVEKNKQSQPTADELKGTYQIQIKGHHGQTRDVIKLPENIFQTIAEKRELDKTTYIRITERCRVKVLSYKEIKAKNFVGLPQQVILESFEPAN